MEVTGFYLLSFAAGLYLGWWLVDVHRAWKDRQFIRRLQRGDYDEALRYWTRDEKDWSWLKETSDKTHKEKTDAKLLEHPLPTGTV